VEKECSGLYIYSQKVKVLVAFLNTGKIFWTSWARDRARTPNRKTIPPTFVTHTLEKPMNRQNLLAFVIVLQVITILNQWFGGPISKARAQIPDAGAQQMEVISQLKTGNETLKAIDDKLDKMLTLFQSGKLQVQLGKPDDNQGK
jgi:hypothetical protein